MTDADVIDGIRRPGRFDATVGSEEEARRLVSTALPHAGPLPTPGPGEPYPSPPPGVKAWIQTHPPEPGAGNDLPHVKDADWTTGKRGRGGSWGPIVFPPAD